MKVSVPTGHYVIAVSGGVDSVVLLHVLRASPGVCLTVAHYDHGIRVDSREDARLVRQLAVAYGLPYVTDRIELGASASEDLARRKRYEFLETVRRASGAVAIITAHHQDDVLETAIHNIIRGTGRRGLSSLRSTDTIMRPLLGVAKSEIIDYARQHELTWREDTTNNDTVYRRNYIRHKIVPRITAERKRDLYSLLIRMHKLNDEIDQITYDCLSDVSEGSRLRRQKFIILPHAVAREIMVGWLRIHGLREIDSTLVERLVHAAKTYTPGSRIHVYKYHELRVSKEFLALEHQER